MTVSSCSLWPAWDPFLWDLRGLLSRSSTGARAIFIFYLLLSVAALVLPPYYGYKYNRNFWADMFSTDLTTSLTLDLIIVLVAFVGSLLTMGLASPLTVLVLLGSCAVAVSVPFPLYLGFSSLRASLPAEERTRDPSLCCSLVVVAIVAISTQIAFIVWSNDLKSGPANSNGTRMP